MKRKRERKVADNEFLREEVDLLRKLKALSERKPKRRKEKESSGR